VIQVHGRFTKLNVEIGRGSFKTVFKGHDAEDGTTIAWCELQSRSRISKKDHKRFKIEADLLKRLQHPSIIRFYDYWEVVESQSREKYFVLITEFMT
jgi:WNK lysine deficient protein kinase